MEETADVTEAQEGEPLVLHLSADYPDDHRGHRKTTAIERLVTGAGYGEHVVFSLDRTSLPWRTHFFDCGIVNGARLYAYRYFGLPAGLGLARSMRTVAGRVARVMAQNHRRPDLIHAHKFSFEGIAGLKLTEDYGPKTRFFVSVRGESERKVLLYKPTYRSLMRRIAERADQIYHVSAWFCKIFHKYVPEQPVKERLLPNIVGNTSRDLPQSEPDNRFVSVFDLNYSKRKGLTDLLKGYSLFRQSHPDTGLDLIGPGSEASIAAAKKEIADLGLEDHVRLLGPMKADALFAALPHYLGMALISYNETFGMVYLEALFAGLPIVYGKNTGIDGYLDDVKAGVGVTPGDTDGIASALAELAENNSSYREAIKSSARVLHDRFNPDSILEGYRSDMQRLLMTDQPRRQSA